MAARRKPADAAAVPAGPQRITARPAAGFWRAGRHWPPRPGVVVAPDDLSAEAWARILAEPLLTVAPIEPSD